MSYCDRFAALRLAVFGQAYPRQPYDIGVNQLITFLKRAEIESLEMYDTYKQYKEAHGMASDSDQDIDAKKE